MSVFSKSQHREPAQHEQPATGARRLVPPQGNCNSDKQQGRAGRRFCRSRPSPSRGEGYHKTSCCTDRSKRWRGHGGRDDLGVPVRRRRKPQRQRHLRPATTNTSKFGFKWGTTTHDKTKEEPKLRKTLHQLEEDRRRLAGQESRPLSVRFRPMVE